MSIFLKSERKDPKVIFLLIIIYFILSAGALTMVYPFLLMISGSLKGKLDAYEFDVVPKFLGDFCTRKLGGSKKCSQVAFQFYGFTQSFWFCHFDSLSFGLM